MFMPVEFMGGTAVVPFMPVTFIAVPLTSVPFMVVAFMAVPLTSPIAWSLLPPDVMLLTELLVMVMLEIVVLDSVTLLLVPLTGTDEFMLELLLVPFEAVPLLGIVLLLGIELLETEPGTDIIDPFTMLHSETRGLVNSLWYLS